MNEKRTDTELTETRLGRLSADKAQSMSQSGPKKYVGRWDLLSNKMTWQSLEEGEEIRLEKDKWSESYYPRIHSGNREAEDQDHLQNPVQQHLCLSNQEKEDQLVSGVGQAAVPVSTGRQNNGVKTTWKKRARSSYPMQLTNKGSDEVGKRKEAERVEDGPGANLKKGRHDKAVAVDQPRHHQ